MDAYLEGDALEPIPDKSNTPHLAYQLNRFPVGEFFANKQIPENALFAGKELLERLKNLYMANLDIPVLVYGLPGCGKLTAIAGLIPNSPAYFPSITERYPQTGQWDARLINNIAFLKSLDDTNYPKLLIYENLYFLNIAVLTNNTEITTYLKQIYRIAKSRSIDTSRKIFVITHIELCTLEQQRYITFMLDKLNSLTSYIFTTTHINKLDTKIRAFCAPIRFTYPSEAEFMETFKYNYGCNKCNWLEKKHLTPLYMKKYWEIYINNKWNIGHTIAQIKYILSKPDITLEKLKLGENIKSLLDNIVANFIKKKMKLTSLGGAMEIRRFIYKLLSINVNLVEFVQCLVRQLLANNLNAKTKIAILAKAGEFSAMIPKINKELIALETLIYQLMFIIYSGGDDSC